MEILLAEPVHVDAVRGCVASAFGEYVGRLGRPPAPMLDDHEELIRRQAVHVAVLDGQVIGVIVMWPEPDHFYVDNVAVDPLFQQHGVGSALLSFAERAARASERSDVRLYTNVMMHENIGYYERRGFTETHRTTEDGHDRVYMTRRLD